MASLIGSIPKLITEITNVALADPLNALLVTVGGLIIAGSVGVFSYLALGAVLDSVIPDLGGEPPQQAR
jgi:hypothetical protein